MSQIMDPAAAALAARADFARLLAACYYEPGPELAEERVFDSLQTAAQPIAADLAERAGRLGAAFAAEPLQEVLIDYTRLFLGPVQPLARPYATAWLGGEPSVMQDVAKIALDFYDEGGFSMADDFRDLPDHVAVGLEFLYVLRFRMARAQLAGDDAAYQAAEGLRRRFLSQYLARWLPPFCEAAGAGACTAYYRELAELTREFVGLEAS